MKKTILSIDDETHILELIKYNLEIDGYTVITSESGEDGLSMINRYSVDAILLDLMLPGMDGFEVLKIVRENEKTRKLPVIMLTAKGEEFHKVSGLEMGADDYISKPFSIRELSARLKSLFRRLEDKNVECKDSVVISKGLEIESETRTVKKDGDLIELSYKEFEILKLLADNPGKAYSRDTLLEKIWGYEYTGETRTVDVHIRHLRKKIEYDDSNPIFIKTVRGYGYKFSEVL